ncbi:MAG TPA: CidA/LrgA family protein [Myxococcaceae bacterium]|nr:CidA/LrgA family protein [Myxococcaceae bacterium]
MADREPAPTSLPPDPAGRLLGLAGLLLQIGLLSAVFGAWLLLGRVWRLPLPAGLLAMLTVLALLLAGLLPLAAVHRGASFLLRYIGILFVPVCIGAVRQLPLLRAHGWAFVGLIVAGALAGQAVAGVVAQALCRRPVQVPAPEGFER